MTPVPLPLAIALAVAVIAALAVAWACLSKLRRFDPVDWDEAEPCWPAADRED